jgi:hypothetical protein
MVSAVRRAVIYLTLYSSSKQNVMGARLSNAEHPEASYLLGPDLALPQPSRDKRKKYGQILRKVIDSKRYKRQYRNLA